MSVKHTNHSHRTFVERLLYRGASRRGFGLAVVILMLVLPVLMQGGRAYAQSQEPVFSVNFTAISLDRSISGLYYDSQSEVCEIYIPNASASANQQYMGASKLVFYTRGNGPDGALVKNPAAAVDLRAYNGQQVLLLFAKDVEHPGRYRVMVVNDDRASFPGNSWRVYNFTRTPVVMKTTEGEPQSLESGAQHTFIGSGVPSRSEEVQIAAQHGDAWELVYNSIWSRRPQLRALIFLTPGANEKSIKVRKIYLPV